MPVSGRSIFVTGDGSVQTKVYIFIVAPLGQLLLLAWRQYNTVQCGTLLVKLSCLWWCSYKISVRHQYMPESGAIFKKFKFPSTLTISLSPVLPLDNTCVALRSHGTRPGVVSMLQSSLAIYPPLIPCMSILSILSIYLYEPNAVCWPISPPKCPFFLVTSRSCRGHSSCTRSMKF